MSYEKVRETLECEGGPPGIPLDNKSGYRQINVRNYDIVVDKNEIDLDFIKKYLLRDYEDYDIEYNIVDDFTECNCCENCNRSQYKVILDRIVIHRSAKHRAARVHIWLTHDCMLL